MNFISPELDIQILKNVEITNTCLYFKFKGKFTQKTAEAGTYYWSDYLSKHDTNQFDFVWDCMDMDGFEIEARKVWYNALQKHKHQIKMVYVVSPRIMIRSAAKVMLQFFGIKSKIGSSESFLPNTIRI